MKKLFSLVLAVALLFSLASVGETITPVNVAALKGPTAMGMVKMMKDEEGKDAYAFTIAASADLVTPSLVKGEIDIACVPANLSSILYNNTKGAVRVIAVNTLGVLYIVERGNTIQSMADLKGRTVYASGKGATPEYALNYLLTESGLNPETDLTVEYKAEHTECLAALLNDENAVALLPQPFVTVAQTKAEDIRVAVDMSAAWDALQEGKENPSGMITGVVIARTSFIEDNPEKVQAFLSEYADSVAFVNENTEEAAKLVGEYDIVAENVAVKALPYCNIVCLTGAEMQTKLAGYLQVLYEQNDSAVGGKVPDDAFYYTGNE